MGNSYKLYLGEMFRYNYPFGIWERRKEIPDPRGGKKCQLNFKNIKCNTSLKTLLIELISDT